jgi:hypothetical protein
VQWISSGLSIIAVRAIHAQASRFHGDSGLELQSTSAAKRRRARSLIEADSGLRWSPSLTLKAGIERKPAKKLPPPTDTAPSITTNVGSCLPTV